MSGEGRFLSRTEKARSAYHQWAVAIAPFTVFLIIVLVLYRTLNIMTIVVLRPCEFAYFWVYGWLEGLALLQIFLYISILSAVIWVIQVLFVRTYGGAWLNKAAQLVLLGLLVFPLLSQYELHFPGKLPALVTEVTSPRDQKGYELVGQLESVRWRAPDLFVPLLRSIERQHPELTGADNNKAIAYVVFIKRDFSYEIVEVPSVNPDYVLTEEGAVTVGDMLALRRCVAALAKYPSVIRSYVDNPEYVWAQSYGTLPWRVSVTIYRDDYEYGETTYQ